MAELTTDLLIGGLGYAECPRWHAGALWFSDFHSSSVHRLTPDGVLTTVAVVPGRPAGLAFGPEGDLYVVSSRDRKLLRIADDGLEEIAVLAPYVGGPANDMVMDAAGRAYIGNFGYDLIGGEPPAPTALLLVEPDGHVSIVAEDLSFPNGMAITSDGLTLIVAETDASGITAFVIADDGTLGGRRVRASFADAGPDGICVDAHGAVWAAFPLAAELRRIDTDGEVTDRIPTPDRWAVACALGAEDRRTLFVLTADTDLERLRSGGGSSAFVEVTRVAVPGAGRP